MTRTKKRSTTVFSRDEIGVEQLQSLKEKFADGDLNEKEFVSLFREIIDASLSETQLTELFQKIDANSDGTVDWDELTNYMFLSGSDNSEEFLGDDSNAYYETAQPEKPGDSNGVDTSSARSGGVGDARSHQGVGHHKDVVTRIVRLDRPYMYLTASKDGTVRTWNAQTMAYQSQIATGKNWITDCCVMRRSNRLAVSSMTRTLGIYDLGSSQLIGEIHEYSRKQCIPLCLEYVEKPADDREALIIGDDTGGITVMTCSNQWMACDGRSSVSAAAASNSGSGGPSAGVGNMTSPIANGVSGGSGGVSGGTSSSISGGGILPSAVNGTASLLETQGFSSRVKFSKHTDWVTRVKWVNDIRAIVATSLDTTVSIIDIDRLVVKFEYTRHKKGVFDLVWCASTRLIASCGMERDISIWNPYSSQRAVATLRGHTSSVLHLASDDDNYQLISVSADNTFKVWDVRNHRCLQTFVDNYKSTGGAENRISALLFDRKQPCLISATTHLSRWPLKASATSFDPDPQEESGVKEKPMCLASYNTVFHQVVTAEMSADAVVKTWSAETGDELCGFSNAHDSSPVTAICFDSAGRRLLTGAHEGDRLKMWNFSNGALVKQFLKNPPEPASSSASTSTKAVPAVSSDTVLYELGSSQSPASPPLTSPTKHAANATPRKKVRDIMVLPPSFGMDSEGRRGSPGSMAATTELPSPTRSRLRRGSEESGERTSRYPRIPVQDKEDQGSRYRQQEVTSVLDIERNLRVGMGDFICQRFVCAVGWDRRIFVWADKNDESEALPVHVLPGNRIGSRNDEDNASLALSKSQRSHSMDILALVYIPPAYVATAGLDGKILLWSLNSGEFVAQLHQSDGSIDTMWYGAKLELLFASGENGQLICVDRSMTTQAVVDLNEMFVMKHERPGTSAITALRCDKANTHLVTGDVSGAVKIWELGIASNHEGVSLEFCCQWHIPVPTGSTASTNRILNVDFVENFARTAEMFLVVAAASGEVMLWTLDGVQVGCFGRHRGWQLGRPSTYASSASSCEWPDAGIEIVDESDEHRHPPTRKHFIQCCSIASCNSSGAEAASRDTSFLLEDSMPKAGEVWVCISGHRSRAGNGNPSRRQDQDLSMPIAPTTPATNLRAAVGISAISSARILLRRTSGYHDGPGGNNSEPLGTPSGLQQKLTETASEITDMITVVAVARGEISCVDATAPSTPKVIAMSDFVRKAGWIKHTLLSQFIGRHFSEGSTNFRVRAVAMSPIDPAKPEKKQFALIDMLSGEHKLQPLNNAISLARFKLQDKSTKPNATEVSTKHRSPSVVRPSVERNRSITSGGPTASALVAPDALDPSLYTDVPPVTLAGSVGMGAVTLPLLRPREKRPMGGMLPKRSMVRNRHDPSLDLRRIHNPDDIPKSFRSVLQHKRDYRDAPFGGILPDT